MRTSQPNSHPFDFTPVCSEKNLINEDTLKMLTENLADLEPRRVQAIVDFALDVSHDPQELTEEDYQKVIDQGVSAEEMTEIIMVAALGVFYDLCADAFKIDLDVAMREALGRPNF